MMDNIFTWLIALVCIVILLETCGLGVLVWIPVIFIGGPLILAAFFALTTSGFTDKEGDN